MGTHLGKHNWFDMRTRYIGRWTDRQSNLQNGGENERMSNRMADCGMTG